MRIGVGEVRHDVLESRKDPVQIGPINMSRVIKSGRSAARTQSSTARLPSGGLTDDRDVGMGSEANTSA